MTKRVADPDGEVILIQVPDADGDREYDLLLPVPNGVNPEVAVAKVERIITAVKAANPAEYTFDDLQEALSAEGLFVPIKIIHCGVWW